MKKSNFGKFLLSLTLFISLLLVSSEASAHKVNIFAYAEEGMVYTEGYFPDGRKVEGGKVEVYDSQGNKLLEGTTTKEGTFDFKIPKVDDLKIVLIATMGHKNSFTIYADELAEATAGVAAEPVAQVARTPAEQTGAKVAQVPAKPSRRRRREPEKESFPVAGVFGGLGFIFGLTALIMQFSGKKKG